MFDTTLFQRKADVRGIYPQEVNEEVVLAIGRAFVSYLNAKQIAVGRDMRLSSPSLSAAFIDGATLQGADVVDYGMIPTDTPLGTRVCTAPSSAANERFSARNWASSTAISRAALAIRWPLNTSSAPATSAPVVTERAAGMRWLRNTSTAPSTYSDE